MEKDVVYVSYIERDTHPAIEWNGYNAENVKEFIDYYVNLDYDINFHFRDDVLWEGNYKPLPVGTWLVYEGGGIGWYGEREFKETFE